MKHTQGPWYIDNVHGDCLRICAAIPSNEGKLWNNPSICAFYEDIREPYGSCAKDEPFENYVNNIQLVVAGPDMLAALEVARDLILELSKAHTFDTAPNITGIEAAIKKAKGE